MFEGYWLVKANIYAAGGAFLHLSCKFFAVDESKTESISAPLGIMPLSVFVAGNKVSSTVGGGIRLRKFAAFFVWCNRANRST